VPTPQTGKAVQSVTTLSMIHTFRHTYFLNSMSEITLVLRIFRFVYFKSLFDHIEFLSPTLLKSAYLLTKLFLKHKGGIVLLGHVVYTDGTDAYFAVGSARLHARLRSKRGRV